MLGTVLVKVVYQNPEESSLLPKKTGVFEKGTTQE